MRKNVRGRKQKAGTDKKTQKIVLVPAYRNIESKQINLITY